MSDFYDISVTLADGTTTTMGGWAGHVLLIANPASTSAHADILAELFTDYAPRGFFALGTYDANDAGGADTPFPYLTHAEELFEYLGEGDTFVVDTSGSAGDHRPHRKQLAYLTPDHTAQFRSHIAHTGKLLAWITQPTCEELQTWPVL